VRRCLVLLALAGCAGPEQAPAPRVELTPVSELPEPHRELLLAYGRGGEAWRTRREALLDEPELARFLVDNLVREMLRAFDASEFAKAGDTDVPFERAQNELVFLQRYSVPVLVELLAIGDGVSTFLCAQTLERVGRPAVVGVTHGLEHEGREARRRAAELLGVLPNAQAGEPWVQEALGQRMLDDPEWIVRAQAAQALGRRAARSQDVSYALGHLAQATGDPDPTVARSAAKGLAGIGDPRAMPVLLRYLERALGGDRPADIRAAQEALREVSGDRRARTPADWRGVWRGMQRGE